MQYRELESRLWHTVTIFIPQQTLHLIKFLGQQHQAKKKKLFLYFTLKQSNYYHNLRNLSEQSPRNGKTKKHAIMVPFLFGSKNGYKNDGQCY